MTYVPAPVHQAPTDSTRVKVEPFHHSPAASSPTHTQNYSSQPAAYQPVKSSPHSNGYAAAVKTEHQSQTAGAYVPAKVEQDAPAVAPRKRSRWGDDQQDSTGAATADSSSNASGAPAKRSRWAQANASDPTAAAMEASRRLQAQLAAKSLAAMTPQQVQSFQTQLRVDELTRRILNPAIISAEIAALPHNAPRSPSPPPEYDQQGQRTNTREIRRRKAAEKERQTLVEQMLRLTPGYKPPVGYRKNTRIERKIFIPCEQHPGYNFLGQIIGPRGNTQKQMEKATGCRIVIRGRGSQKSADSGKESDEPMHVLIMGDDEEKLNQAQRMVDKLLIPLDDSANEHKSRQLRELAQINGTLRDSIVCRHCGNEGHRVQNCPARTGAQWQAANVRCEICNADSHLTQDCPNQSQPGFNKQQQQADLANEYAQFMNEIDSGSQSVNAPISGLLTGAAPAGGSGTVHQPPPAAPRPVMSGFVAAGAAPHANGSAAAGPAARAPPHVHPSRLNQVARDPPSHSHSHSQASSRVVQVNAHESARVYRPQHQQQRYPPSGSSSYRRDPPGHSSQAPQQHQPYQPAAPLNQHSHEQQRDDQQQDHQQSRYPPPQHWQQQQQQQHYGQQGQSLPPPMQQQQHYAAPSHQSPLPYPPHYPSHSQYTPAAPPAHEHSAPGGYASQAPGQYPPAQSIEVQQYPPQQYSDDQYAQAPQGQYPPASSSSHQYPPPHAHYP